MNKHDMAKLRNGARGFGMILRRDQNEMDKSVKLSPTDRQYIQKVRSGLLELLASDKERLEQRLDLSQTEYAKALEDNFDIQLEMFSEDGKPTTPLDANGKMIPTKRNFDGDPNYPEPGDGGGVGDAGEQLELGADSAVDKLAETITDLVVGKGPEAVEQLTEGLKQITGQETPEPSNEWSVKPDVPEAVQVGLVGHVANKKTRAEAIKLVCKATGQPKLVIEGHFDKLVEKGAIAMNGRTAYIPDKSAAPPAPEPAPQTSIQEMILRELREGKTDIEVVISNVMFQSDAERGVISRVLMDMCDNGLVDELPDGRWVAAEPSDVPTEEVIVGDDAPVEAVEKTVVAAIKERLKEKKGDRETIIESVSMELQIPAHQVEQEWKTMVFAGFVRRGGDGLWMLAPEMEPEAQAS